VNIVKYLNTKDTKDVVFAKSQKCDERLYFFAAILANAKTLLDIDEIKSLIVVPKQYLSTTGIWRPSYRGKF
jgi:hypothetical protein